MLHKSLVKKLTSFIALPLLLTACDGGIPANTTAISRPPNAPTALTLLPDGSAINDRLMRFATKMQGTWKATDCSKQEQSTYYGKIQLTISGWSIVLTNTYYNDSQCAQNEIGKLVRYALITDLTRPSSKLYKLLVVVEKTDMTPLSRVAATDWNNRTACGLNGWNEGIAQTLGASYLCQYGPTAMDSVGSGAGNFSLIIAPDFTSEPNTLNSQGKILIRL